MLLLVTNQRDITMDYVVAELQRRKIPYFRLNTEHLPQALCTMSPASKGAWSIEIDGRLVTGEQVTAAYFRRPGLPSIPTSVGDSGERAYAQAEWSCFLKSLYTRLDGAWLNAPTDIWLAEDKPRQLLLAHEIGFNVPETATTNDIASVRKVADLAATTVGKPLRQALLPGEQERVIFTTRLGDLKDTDAAAISVAPFIVQHEIRKKYDVRVTAVGDRLFATAIWSQEWQETEVDWRQGSRPDLKHERIELPEAVQEQCRELLSRLNLRFGAIDFICDEAERLWFLEINPNGQWAWIENVTGYRISEAIVDELEKGARG
ncbi:MAG: hypothetical protein CMQ46_10475 [Gammaproteobacteria bacterium]|nr:hypothetical protein [Gammaproteobacteria bacterium]MBJ55672.1 hypothetical protein [Gammaproteobacteria bacterium]|tara:strand:+ start:3035 stop:3991 length:957 start_codon:yes stop_codon:yes gene_type:complete